MSNPKSSDITSEIKDFTLDLYSQIQAIYSFYEKIVKETSGIVNNNDMPDSAFQLQDVLLATEKATNDILNSTLEIQEQTTDPKITAEVTKILEACNFQDITGQRIKKVLRNLDQLESRLKNLADIARVTSTVSSEPAVEEKLERGPQLQSVAPSQQDIDALFDTAN